MAVHDESLRWSNRSYILPLRHGHCRQISDDGNERRQGSCHLVSPLKGNALCPLTEVVVQENSNTGHGEKHRAYSDTDVVIPVEWTSQI